MTRRTLAASEKNGKGETARTQLRLDQESMKLLGSTPHGFGGAYIRKAMARLLAHLEGGGEPPPMEPVGVASLFTLKAPADLLDRVRSYVGPGKPYSTLSGLARTAIHWSGQ